MEVRTVKDVDLKSKQVLMRADFNVPLKDGEITDDMRIQAALPTIRFILEQQGSSLVLMSHLGRPKGEIITELSLKPVAKHLGELLGKEVKMAPDCIGEEVEKMADTLKPSEILLLENVRFHGEETKNDPEFAKKLANLGQIYVNDAFGTAHRSHASTVGITKYLQGVAGFLIEKEVKFFSNLVENPRKPFVAIIGGAKVSTKIGVLQSLLAKVNSLIIGGAMAYTFLKAMGHKIGNSLCEDEYINTAIKLLSQAEERGIEIILPCDHIVADKVSEQAEPQLVADINIPDDKIGVDIGPQTLNIFKEKIKNAQSVIWNGPLGVFEINKFAKGTLELAKYITECQATTVVGGGDIVAAVNQFGLAPKIDHVSTGGGASLEFLEGKSLPGIVALEKK